MRSRRASSTSASRSASACSATRCATSRCPCCRWCSAWCSASWWNRITAARWCSPSGDHMTFVQDPIVAGLLVLAALIFARSGIARFAHRPRAGTTTKPRSLKRSPTWLAAAACRGQDVACPTRWCETARKLFLRRRRAVRRGATRALHRARRSPRSIGTGAGAAARRSDTPAASMRSAPRWSTAPPRTARITTTRSRAARCIPAR